MNNKIIVAFLVVLIMVVFLQSAYIFSLRHEQTTNFRWPKIYEQYPLTFAKKHPHRQEFPQQGMNRMPQPQSAESPLRQMELMQQRMNEEMKNNLIRAKETQLPNTITAQNNEKAYILIMPAPGLSKEDINLEVNGKFLKISGVKKYKNNVKDNKGNAIEESNVGSFMQVVTLPEDVIVKEITSEYKEGVLTVNLPKKQAVIKEDVVKIPVK